MKSLLLALALHAVDYGQTLEIARNKAYFERNAILGGSPSRSAIHGYFLTTGAAIVAGHYLTKGKARRFIMTAAIVNGAVSVANNYSIGVKVAF